MAVFSTNPVVASWSNQMSVTVSWSNLTDFSNISGYRYTFDQTLETSTVQSSYPFMASTTITSSTLSTGIYYFHLWPVSSSNTISPVVHTIGPFFLDIYAPNTPVLKDIPDIKLLKDSKPVTLFNLIDYTSNTSVPWAY